MPPHLEIEPSIALRDAPFSLVEARIDWGGGRTSQGWGRDASPSRAAEKAVCEAIERHSQRCLPEARWAKMADVGDCIDPRHLVRHAPWQYRTDGNGPWRFEPGETRCWLVAEPVSGTGARWVVADAVCNPRAFDPDYLRRLLTHATTSGCASGYTLEETLLRATLELIERDAMMRHWFAQKAGAHLVRDSLPHPMARRLRRLHDAGCDAGVQCLTMGVHPVWLAWAQHPGLGFTCTGSATGLDATESLEAALAEMETAALARLEGLPPVEVRVDDVDSASGHAALYATAGHFRQADALWRVAGLPLRFDRLVQAFAIESGRLYARAAAAGHPVHWVDLTVPEAHGALHGRTVHTVRAVAPGLIPLCFGRARAPLGMDRWRRSDPSVLHPFA